MKGGCIATGGKIIIILFLDWLVDWIRLVFRTGPYRDIAAFDSEKAPVLVMPLQPGQMADTPGRSEDRMSATSNGSPSEGTLRQLRRPSAENQLTRRQRRKRRVGILVLPVEIQGENLVGRKVGYISKKGIKLTCVVLRHECLSNGSPILTVRRRGHPFGQAFRPPLVSARAL